MAKALLDMGVDENQGKVYAPNENALFSALARDDVEMVRLLLEHGETQIFTLTLQKTLLPPQLWEGEAPAEPLRDSPAPRERRPPEGNL